MPKAFALRATSLNNWSQVGAFPQRRARGAKMHCTSVQRIDCWNAHSRVLRDSLASNCSTASQWATTGEPWLANKTKPCLFAHQLEALHCFGHTWCLVPTVIAPGCRLCMFRICWANRSLHKRQRIQLQGLQSLSECQWRSPTPNGSHPILW